MKELKETDFADYSRIKRESVKELDHYDELISALEAISKLRCDAPCRLGGDGCAGQCQITKCVCSRGFEGCWECDEFEKYDKFEFLRPFHGDAVQKNLRLIRYYGLNKWASHREKCYPWQ